MNRLKYLAYIIGAVLLFSSFDIQKRAEALQKAYEEKNYDAFVDAFPDKYEDFGNILGYDGENDKLGLLYHGSEKYIDFLFDNEKVMEDNVLDKLLSLSYNFIWEADAVSFVIMRTMQLLVDYPQKMTEYFSKKTDEEVISFIQMSLTCLLSDNPVYLSEYNRLIETYTAYSDRIVKLAKIAFKRAKQACDVLVVY